MPVASVVVPAFNASTTLSATLRALQAQTCKDFEIIVVDDGSRDTTPVIALDAARNDPRIHVVRQANRGLAGARNSGIAAARGDFIGFCDADVLWLPDKLATHIRHLQASPSVGVSFSGAMVLDRGGNLIGKTQVPRLSGITAHDVFLHYPIENASTVVMRRETIKAIAWHPRFESQRAWVFDETFARCDDIECWLRLALTTDWKLEGIDGDLVQWHLNPLALSESLQQRFAYWDRMVTKLTPLDPDFFFEFTHVARAFKCKRLAQLAICLRDGKDANAMITECLSSSRTPLFQEPMTTLSTLVSAMTLCCAESTPIKELMAVFQRSKTQM